MRGKITFHISMWIALLQAFNLNAQVNRNEKLYQLGWDNDVLMMTDYYYTQGMGLFMYHPVFQMNPANLVLLKPSGYDQVIYGFSVDQRTYTPRDIKSYAIQFNDRPYAGVLVFTSKSIAANQNQGLMLRSELDIGVMGPASGAGTVQYKYHEGTNNALPQGWGYQHYNWPVFNYNLTAHQRLGDWEKVEIYGKGQLRLGTLHDDATFGMLIRTGFMNNYIETLGLPIAGKDQDWQLFVNVEPTLTVVGYNATLQGGWHRNPKLHYVSYSDMNKIVARVSSGFGLNYKFIGLNFNVIWNSSEFKKGVNHWYTSTRLYFVF